MKPLLKLQNYYLALLSGLVLLFLLLGRSSASNSQVPSSEYRRIRSIEATEAGLQNPAGLAYSPLANSFIVQDASSIGASGNSDIFMINHRMENLAGVINAGDPIFDPSTMAFDQQSNSLYYFDPVSDQLVQIQASQTGIPGSFPEAIIRHDLASLNLGQVRGLSFDPETGNLFVLDAAVPRIVSIRPGWGGTFDGQAAMNEGRISQIALTTLNAGNPRGVAFNPGNGRLYIMSASGREVHEVTLTGQTTAVRDLPMLNLSNPQGMTFAPSGDATDDPANLNLYIVDSGREAAQTGASSTGQIVELALSTQATKSLTPQMANLSSSLRPSGTQRVLRTWSIKCCCRCG